MPTWNANLYLEFASERTQPSIDLVARIALTQPGRIIDLGCGPGNSTAVVRNRWPEAEIAGLDNSPDMIAKARADFPGSTWELGEIASWQPASSYDLIFSNASLHWVPDHLTLIPRLLSQVAPGGALAVQMPAHVDSPVHRAISEIAQDPIWRHRTAAAPKAEVGPPEFYYDVLSRDAARIDLWVTVYEHVLTGPAAIVEWIKGTGLRPFLESLESDSHRAEFTSRLLARVAADHPPRADGQILFPFRRLFFVAYRK